MSVSANYSQPVIVNGYSCDNCAQVAEAKKGINPADPKAGPGGVNAGTAADPTTATSITQPGGLKKASAAPGTGLLLDLSA